MCKYRIIALGALSAAIAACAAGGATLQEGVDRVPAASEAAAAGSEAATEVARQAEQRQEAAAEDQAPPRIDAAPFIIMTNEPFYALELNRSEATLMGPHVDEPRDYSGLVWQRATDGWAVSGYSQDDEPFSAMIQPGYCRDTMSDIIYEWNAILELDDEELQGCAVLSDERPVVPFLMFLPTNEEAQCIEYSGEPLEVGDSLGDATITAIDELGALVLRAPSEREGHFRFSVAAPCPQGYSYIYGPHEALDLQLHSDSPPAYIEIYEHYSRFVGDPEPTVVRTTLRFVNNAWQPVGLTCTPEETPREGSGRQPPRCR